MSSIIKVKYVSKKVSKIKWKPKSFSTFITGTFDDDENNLTLWKLPNTYNIKENETGENFEENEPTAVHSEVFQGCVTDLKIASDELFFVSSSLGSLSMYKYSEEKMQCIYTWKNVHWFKREIAATTAIDVKGQEVASVGEDGRLCVFNFTHMQKIKDIECSDLCAFTTISYLRHQEIVVGNALGYLRLWDLRIPSNISSTMLIHTRNQNGISSMKIHPTQNHVLATGSEDGSMHIWDMRQEKQPVAILDGHSAAISELLFHSSNPDFLFTCSLDGTVLQWNSSTLRNNYSSHNPLSTPDLKNATKKNPWLTCETNKHQLEITSLFSQSTSCVNSLDSNGSVLLWVTDNEAIHIYNDIEI